MVARSTPALLVHGIWDSAVQLAPLERSLVAAHPRRVRALTLAPNDGSETIENLAEQIASAASDLRRQTGIDRVDLVGFSMGALACRYYVQRLGGRHHVSRFVSIAGPHAGTMTAYATAKPAVKQMRPGSALLRDLAADRDPWGDVRVYTLWSPFDLMIVPARSSRLPGAVSDARVRVTLHRWMITDARVLKHVTNILAEG